MKNDENGEESPWNRLRKRLESVTKALRLGFFSRKQFFLTNFEKFLNTRRAEHFCSALFPLFIGEKREVVAAQLAQASKVASTRRHRHLLEPLRRPKWTWLLFAPPIFTKYTPFCVFFTDFFSKCCGTLQITQWHPFFFLECCKTLRIYAKSSFSFRNVAKLTDYATMLVSRVPNGPNKVQGPTASTPGRNQGMTTS